MGESKFRFVFAGIFLVTFLFLIAYAFAAHTVTRSTGGTTFNFLEDVNSAVLNITVNATHAEADGLRANITDVNITLPSTFLYITSTTGTTADGLLSNFAGNTTTTLVYHNNTYLVNASVTGSLTNRSFWLNFSASTPGIYNVTITTKNLSLLGNTNITVRINDTTRPVVSASNVTTQGTSGSALVSFINQSGIVVFNVSVFDNSHSSAVFLNVTNSSGQVFIVNLSAPLGTTEGTTSVWNGTFSTSLLGDGLYNFTVFANDTYGNITNVNNSAFVPIFIDNTVPSVSISCTPSSVSQGDTVTCSCSGSDATSGVNVTSYTTNPSTTQSGTFTTSCSVVDLAGNINSESTTYTVSGTTGTGSSSGSSSGGSSSSTTSWTQTIAQDANELSQTTPVSQALGSSHRVKLKIGGEAHTVGVKSIGSSSVTIQVASTPQDATLNVGDTKKFELNGDGFYDLSVTLKSITAGKANLEMVALHEAVPSTTTQTTTSETPSTTGTNSGAETSSSSSWVIWVVVLLVVVVVVVIFLRKRRN